MRPSISSLSALLALTLAVGSLSAQTIAITGGRVYTIAGPPIAFLDIAGPDP